MMMSPVFMQFAYFLGRFQWLTCPRKVTILISAIILEEISVLFLMMVK